MLQGAREGNITVSDDELHGEIATRKAVRGEQQFAEDLATAAMTLEEYGEKLREKMLLDKFVDSLVPKDSVTEEEMKEFYKNSPTPFLRPEEVHVAFIQASTEEEADNIVADIKKEKDFDKVAGRLDDEKRAVVSRYGWTSPNVYSPEITEAMKNMKEGEFSGPHKGSEGYYIIRLKERTPEGVKSYEEAKEEIRAIFLSQRRQAALIHWVANKRKSANIIIN
jgi:parvulin-like peptidyl-prolyl isomerase